MLPPLLRPLFVCTSSPPPPSLSYRVPAFCCQRVGREKEDDLQPFVMLGRKCCQRWRRRDRERERKENMYVIAFVVAVREGAAGGRGWC